jgi:hypothetical protein
MRVGVSAYRRMGVSAYRRIGVWRSQSAEGVVQDSPGRALGLGSPKRPRTEGASQPNLHPRHTVHRVRQHKSSRSGSRRFDVRCYGELSQKTVRKITIPSVSRQFLGSDFS